MNNTHAQYSTQCSTQCSTQSYTQRTFSSFVEKVKEMLENGSTADEIALATNSSQLIVEGIIENYVKSKLKSKD